MNTIISKEKLEELLKSKDLEIRKIAENIILENFDVNFLWALEKNEGARRFYNRHGFIENGEKEFEEGTTEYIVRMVYEGR